AGEPAPSQITASNSVRNCANSSCTTAESLLRSDQYSVAVATPATCPLMTSCEVMSLPGLSKIGLNRTLGARPAARACIAWARPISPPSTVTAELFDMFCALNGATRIPLRTSNRHSPATTIDLPASDVVPATSSAPLTGAGSRKGEDFRTGVGDQQGVLELSGPFAVCGDNRPVVVPDFVIQRPEVDHRFDGECHSRFEDGGDGWVGVVVRRPPDVGWGCGRPGRRAPRPVRCGRWSRCRGR